MRDELIKKQVSTSPFANEFSIGNIAKECEIRGIVKKIHDGSDIQRGNKVIDSCYYLEVDFFRVNETNYKAFVGTAKIYIPTVAMGMRDMAQSIFYYPSTDITKKEVYFQTVKKDLTGLHKKLVGVMGMMRDSPQDQYTHFMNKVKKVVVFLSPEELQGTAKKK